MPRPVLRNVGGVPFLTLKGVFVVRARQQPDGDTIHFAATKAFKPGPVGSRVPVDRTGATSVAVRLQSIDAPEKAQPRGATARDVLLDALGIDPGDSGLSETDFTADGETVTVPGWLATHGLDGNKRQLGYVFGASFGFRHGQVVPASAIRDALPVSANHQLVANGAAFPAFYSNTDETHAVLFQDAAIAARSRRRGVWASDRTTIGFEPTPQALGVGGALVYPKFFRRVTDWKQARPSADAFLAWLRRHPDGRKDVQGAARRPMRLAELFEKVSAREVAVPYDVTRLWFSE